MLDRFDGTCERNLAEMLGMEWERDIEAGWYKEREFRLLKRSCHGPLQEQSTRKQARLTIL